MLERLVRTASCCFYFPWKCIKYVLNHVTPNQTYASIYMLSGTKLIEVAMWQSSGIVDSHNAPVFAIRDGYHIFSQCLCIHQD